MAESLYISIQTAFPYKPVQNFAKHHNTDKLWWLVSLLLVVVSKKVGSNLRITLLMDIAGNWSEVRHSWILVREITLHEHYFTPSAIEFYTNFVDKNASIKPSARGQENDCCLLQPCIHRIFWIWWKKGPFCIFLIRLSPLAGQRKGEIKFTSQK